MMNPPNQVSQARTHPAGSFSLLTNVRGNQNIRIEYDMIKRYI